METEILERKSKRMKTQHPEFAPLARERAEELKDIINTAGREKGAVVIDPDEDGVTGFSPVDLVSPNENTNALVRYRRHYSPAASGR